VPAQLEGAGDQMAVVQTGYVPARGDDIDMARWQWKSERHLIRGRQARHQAQAVRASAQWHP